MNSKSTFLLICALIIDILSRHIKLDGFIYLINIEDIVICNQQINDFIFFIGQDIKISMLMWVICLNTYDQTKIIAKSLFLLSLFKIIDELTGIATKYNILEYVIFAALLVCTIIKLKRCNNLEKNY